MNENALANNVELSVVMPCLNEALTLSACITKAKDFFKYNNVNGEVVVADNGSCDGSQEIALSHGAVLVKAERLGYGNALIAGFKNANGKYIIMGDADDSYDFLAIDGLVQSLRSGNDLVIGNRFLGGIEDGAMPFLHKYLGNPVLSFLGRLFFRQSAGDFHCGLRGITKNAVDDLQLKSPGMEFASEMIVKASLKGYKIAEVPVKLKKDGRNRKPHLRTWPDGWRHLKFLLLLCPRYLFLIPGGVMLLLGCILSSILSFGQIKIGDVNFGIHTLFYSSMFYFIGFQLVTFYIYSRIYWNNIGVYSLKPIHEKIIKWYSVEKGLIAGAVMVAFGFILSVYAIDIWHIADFKNLRPEKIFKIVIPSGFTIILGFQVAFSSLFMNMLSNNQ